MKLLLWAIRTASLTDMEEFPLLWIMVLGVDGSRLVPRSLQRRTGSILALAGLTEEDMVDI